MSENQFLAAREKDVLLHPSLLADFVSGVVKGAIYAAAGAVACVAMAVTFPASLLVAAAVGLAVGFVFGEAIDAVADAVADWFPPSADAFIVSGSPNVRTKALPAARAAGKMQRDALLSQIARDREEPPPGKAARIAAGILQKVTTLAAALTPAGPLMAAQARLRRDDPPPVAPERAGPRPGFWASVGSNILSPQVAGAHPDAEPAGGDKIRCTKWHFDDGGPYLAEGAKRVQINGQPACRQDDRSTCEAKIAPEHAGSRVRIGGGSVVVRAIHSGKNPFAAMAGEIVGALGVGLATGGRQALMTCIKSAACDLLTDTVVTAVTTVGFAAVGEALSRSALSGNPVHFARGSKILADDAEQDFVLGGHVPLLWQRMYNSRNPRRGALGNGWTLPFEFYIEVRDRGGEEAVFWLDLSGRELGLGVLPPDMSARYTDEGFTLYRSAHGTFLMQTGDGMFYLFAEDPQRAGRYRLHQQLDRHENRLEYHYDTQGRLLQIADGVRQLQVTLRYDPGHSHLTQVVQRLENDGERVLVRYDYAPSGGLVRVTDADGVIARRYDYDPVHGLMTRHTSATGLTAHYRYRLFPEEGDEEAHYRVVEHRLQAGETVLESMRLRYDLAFRQVEVTEEGKGTSYRRWKKNGLVTAFVDEEDNVWTFAWNDADGLSQATDPAGHRWRFDYDVNGNLTHATDPEGQTTHIRWDDDFAVPRVRVMPGGGTWRYRYGERGDLVGVSGPGGEETAFAYDDAGNCVYRRDAKNNETRYGYNPRGQLVSQTDCAGRVTRFQYDEAGHLSRTQNARQETEHVTLSPGGRLLARRFADGASREYRYAASGLLESISEDGEVRVRYDYNARGQVTQRRQDGGMQRLKYDNQGRLSALYNEKGEPWRFHYGASGGLEEEVRPDGTRRRLTRDRTGAVIKEVLLGTEGGRLETRLTRDRAGRLVLKETADWRTGYEYPAGGLRIRHSRRDERQAAGGTPPEERILYFSFDAAGRLAGELNHQGQYRYEYDETGSLTETTLPDGSALHHLYYGSGHLLQSEFRRGGRRYPLADYARDELHREVSRTLGSLTESTDYDARGRITARLCRKVLPDGHSRFSLARRYHYNRRHQLDRMTLTPDGGATTTTEYHYDAADRVTARYTDAEPEFYRYDLTGNLLDGAGAAWNDRTCRAGHHDYDHDEFGRMRTRTHRLTGVVQHFEYDGESRVTSVSFTGHHRYRRVSHDYDALGRRTAKTVTFRHPLEPERRTEFHWQGMRLSGEQTRGRALTLHFYHGESHTPLARFDCSDDGGGELSFVHAESNGMPLRLSDARGETVWQAQRWGLHGKIKREESRLSPWVSDQNLRFAGQYHDEETGLHYNTLRYYDPESGRFTQPDPIGLKGGLNLYAYAPNPLSWIDPLGLAKCHFSGNRGRNKAAHDIEQNGYKIVAEEVTMKVNGSRIRADFVAADGHGNYHVFEAKHGNSGLTKNQGKSGVFDMGSPSNTVNGIGGGTITPSSGTQGKFKIATGNKDITRDIGARDSSHDAIFHVLSY